MKRIKTTYFLFICFFFLIVGFYPFKLNAQSADTLYQHALKAKDISMGIKLAKQCNEVANLKSNKQLIVNSLNLIAEYFWDKDMNDSAKFYDAKALQSAEKFDLKPLEANTWAILGLVDYRDANYEKAIAKYNQAILLYEKQNDKLNIAINLKNVGICERKLSKNKEALTYFLETIKIFEILGNKTNLSSVYNSISLCFASLGNYQKAIEFNKKAISIRLFLKDIEKVAQSYNNIGFVFKEDNRPDSAILYLKKSLALYQKQHNDSSVMVLPLQNLGSAYKMENKLVLAERYIKRSLNIAANYQMREENAEGNLDLAELYLAQKKYNEALAAVSITENTAQALRLPELLMHAHGDKYQIYLQKGNYKNALYYEAEKDKIKDSIFSVAKDKAINELEIKYQSSLKDKDITTLKFENRLQKNTEFALVIGAVMLTLLLVTAYYGYRQKTKDHTRIKMLIRELNHRTSNNLSILHSILSIQAEGTNLNDGTTSLALKEMEARVISIGLIHNQLFLNDASADINMSNYLTKLLSQVKAGLGSEQKNITLFFDFDQIILGADKAVSIGLIINELAVNSYKFAWVDATYGEIHLSLKQENKSRLLLKYRDNGRGVKEEDFRKERSFGIKLIKILAKQLNSQLFIDSENGARFQMLISI